jgi:hypothetical protein
VQKSPGRPTALAKGAHETATAAGNKHYQLIVRRGTTYPVTVVEQFAEDFKAAASEFQRRAGAGIEIQKLPGGFLKVSPF